MLGAIVLSNRKRISRDGKPAAIRERRLAGDQQIPTACGSHCEHGRPPTKSANATRASPVVTHRSSSSATASTSPGSMDSPVLPARYACTAGMAESIGIRVSVVIRRKLAPNRQR